MRWLTRVSPPAFALLLSACITLTASPRAVIRDAGAVRVGSLPCAVAQSPRAPGTAASLDPDMIRVLTWNIHKQDDAGWERDLARFAAASDVVLLQEAALDDALRRLLDAQRFEWLMASSFLYEDMDFGVLTAARVPPLSSCTERVVEPLLRIPKSAVVSWFALAGRAETLAVVNVHAINFSVSLGTYEAQFDALVRALLGHSGPIVFAGDFNTWTAARSEVVEHAASALRLTEVPFVQDGRSVFFGRQLDHVLVRGFDVVEAAAFAVTSSDHNAVHVTLRLSPSIR